MSASKIFTLPSGQLFCRLLSHGRRAFARRGSLRELGCTSLSTGLRLSVEEDGAEVCRPESFWGTSPQHAEGREEERPPTIRLIPHPALA
jgi:hypothetical protein